MTNAQYAEKWFLDQLNKGTQRVPNSHAYLGLIFAIFAILILFSYAMIRYVIIVGVYPFIRNKWKKFMLERGKNKIITSSESLRNEQIQKLMFMLVCNNNYLDFSTLDRKGEGKDLLMYVNFSLYNYEEKERENVNVLINEVLNNTLKIYKTGGEFLKGSILMKYDELDKVKKQLEQILQVDITLNAM